MFKGLFIYNSVLMDIKSVMVLSGVLNMENVKDTTNFVDTFGSTSSASRPEKEADKRAWRRLELHSSPLNEDICIE